MNSNLNTLSIDMNFLDQDEDFFKSDSVPCRSFVRYLAKLSLHINHLARDCDHLEKKPEHITKILYKLLITSLTPSTYIKIIKSVFSIPKKCVSYFFYQLSNNLSISQMSTSNQSYTQSQTDAERIAVLQRELDLLKEQIIKISNNHHNSTVDHNNHEKSRPQPQISTPFIEISTNYMSQESIIPPPPPIQSTMDFSSNKTSKVLTSSPCVTKSKLNHHKTESNENKALPMFEILKDITKVKLRPVQRSPGGRPIKMSRKSLSVSDDINDHFNHSLRKQFRSVRSPKTSPIKDFSPIKPKNIHKKSSENGDYCSQENLSINDNLKPSDIGRFIEYALKKKFDSEPESNTDKVGMEGIDCNKSTISDLNSSMNWMS